MKWPGRMAGEALRHLVRSPATVRYPAVPAATPAGFRGTVVFQMQKCTGCKLCEKDCPANAIAIAKVGEKRFEAEVYLDRCIMCGQCADSCNRDCIELTPEFELAALDRNALRAVYHAPAAAIPAPADAT